MTRWALFPPDEFHGRPWELECPTVYTGYQPKEQINLKRVSEGPSNQLELSQSSIKNQKAMCVKTTIHHTSLLYSSSTLRFVFTHNSFIQIKMEPEQMGQFVIEHIIFDRRWEWVE